jgi:hypothetical protein
MRPNFEEDRMKRRVIFNSRRIKRSFNFNAISHAALEVYFKLTFFFIYLEEVYFVKMFFSSKRNILDFFNKILLLSVVIVSILI